MMELPVFLTSATTVSATAASALVAAMWEGLVLAGGVALALRAVPRIPAAARSVVWLATMGLVCGLPFLHFAAAGSVSGAGGVSLDFRWSLAIVAVWVAASLFRAAELVRSAVYLRGISGRAVEIECAIPPPQGRGDGAPGLLFGAASRTGRGVRVCASDEVDRPSVVGFFAPKILIPRDLLGVLTASELEQVLLHEAEHLRRRDDWTNLLQKLALVAFPLNPALVWIERQLCLERELACDDRVLEAGAQLAGARKAYAVCLANLAEHRLVRRGVSLALGAWERRPELVRRVHRILAGSAGEMSRGRAGLAVTALLAGVLAGGDALAHSPRLVSFGAPVAVAREARLDSELPLAPLPHPFQSRKGWGTELPSPHAFQSSKGWGTESLGRTTAVPVRMAGSVAGGERKPVRDVVWRRRWPKTSAVRVALPRHRVQNDRAMDEPTLVMVTWRLGSEMAQGYSAQSLQFRYAAVPTGDGWLFVQL